LGPPSFRRSGTTADKSTFMNKNKIIIFDFDGVIVDSCSLSFSINKESIIGLEYEEWRTWAEGNVYKIKLKEDQGDKTFHFNHYHKRYKEQISELLPVEGIEDVFKKILEMGYELVIISGASEEPIEGFLKKYDLKKYFDGVFGWETNESKSEKFKMIFEKYKIKPQETLIVTDSIGDIKEAIKEKIKSIGVGWGVHDLERLKEFGADFGAEKPEDILTGIKKILVLN
jgi:phosphoglycolate phosphatase-like HAD superfamily hydrolase